MERKVSIVVKGNGSLDVIDEEEESNILQGIFVGVTLLMSTILNLSLFASVTGNDTVKNDTGSRLLAVFSLFLALDAIINHTFSLIFIYTWDLLPLPVSLSLCRYSAFFSLFSLLQTGVYIAIMALDIAPLKLLPPFQIFLIIIFPSIYSIITPLTIIIFPQMTPTRHLTNRSVCSVIGGNTVYAGAVLLLGFLIPWSTIGYVIISTRCWMYNDEQTVNPITLFSNNRKLMPIIILLYTVFVIPHAILAILFQFTTTHYLKYDPHHVNTAFYTLSEDTIFIWFRYQFNVIIPIIVYVMLKEIRKPYSDLLCDCDSIASNASFRKTKVKAGTATNPNKTLSKELTPVLFPTQAGLILRLHDTTSKNNKKYSYILCDQIKSENSLNDCRGKKNSEKNFNENRKMVRFAQSVKEIPTGETGSWESTEHSESLHTIELKQVTGFN